MYIAGNVERRVVYIQCTDLILLAHKICNGWFSKSVEFVKLYSLENLSENVCFMYLICSGIVCYVSVLGLCVMYLFWDCVFFR